MQKHMAVVAQDPAIMKYFPDWKPGKKLPPRDFFWHIINKLKPSYVKQIVASAISNREELLTEQEGKEVQVKSEIIEQIYSLEEIESAANQIFSKDKVVLLAKLVFFYAGTNLKEKKLVSELDKNDTNINNLDKHCKEIKMTDSKLGENFGSIQ